MAVRCVTRERDSALCQLAWSCDNDVKFRRRAKHSWVICLHSPLLEALRTIQANELVLPAIQREYVWKPSQVVRLFDSILRGYPIGSFLAWRINPEMVERFKFYGFLKDYLAFDIP